MDGLGIIVRHKDWVEGETVLNLSFTYFIAADSSSSSCSFHRASSFWLSSRNHIHALAIISLLNECWKNFNLILLFFFVDWCKYSTMAFIQSSYRSIIYNTKWNFFTIKLILFLFLCFCGSAKQMWFWVCILLACDDLALMQMLIFQ